MSLIAHRPGIPGWSGELQHIGRRRVEPGKPVVAVRVRGRGVDHVIGVTEQRHQHAGRARFACVLQSIAIGVIPDAVANRDRGLLDQSAVQGCVVYDAGSSLVGTVFRRTERHRSVEGDDRVGAVCSCPVGRRPSIARRRRELQAVTHLSVQRGEPVIPVTVRDRGRDQVAGGPVPHGHRHVRSAWFTSVLQAIFIGVIPDPIADRDRSGWNQPAVDRRIVCVPWPALIRASWG